LPAHQLQGELAISVPRHRHPRATITAGKGWGICRFTRSYPHVLLLHSCTQRSFLHIQIFCTAKSSKALQRVANFSGCKQIEKSGSISTLLSPLHVIFSDFSDFSDLLQFLYVRMSCFARVHARSHDTSQKGPSDSHEGGAGIDSTRHARARVRYRASNS
jgi:hypothetical protein